MDFIKFLIKAKKQTYANSNAKKVTSSRLGANDYQFEEEIDGKSMKYHDTYFGGTCFMGEEVLYCQDNIPIWGMNYYGVTLDKKLSEEAMDKALRPALMHVGEDASVLPVRGPSQYQNGEYRYSFKNMGNIESFTGIEEIYKNDKLIFRLHCHGGMIQS